jgi:hypothetical protein
MRSIYNSMGQDPVSYRGARPFMPPFVASDEEREALTYFIFEKL